MKKLMVALSLCLAGLNVDLTAMEQKRPDKKSGWSFGGLFSALFKSKTSSSPVQTPIVQKSFFNQIPKDILNKIFIDTLEKCNTALEF